MLNIESSSGQVSKAGTAHGLHSYFSDEGSLYPTDKVMSAED